MSFFTRLLILILFGLSPISITLAQTGTYEVDRRGSNYLIKWAGNPGTTEADAASAVMAKACDIAVETGNTHLSVRLFESSLQNGRVLAEEGRERVMVGPNGRAFGSERTPDRYETVRFGIAALLVLPLDSQLGIDIIAHTNQIIDARSCEVISSPD